MNSDHLSELEKRIQAAAPKQLPPQLRQTILEVMQAPRKESKVLPFLPWIAAVAAALTLALFLSDPATDPAPAQPVQISQQEAETSGFRPVSYEPISTETSHRYVRLQNSTPIHLQQQATTYRITFENPATKETIQVDKQIDTVTANPVTIY
ncbi:hypothetical protein SAMN02745181_2454 [Rubritalea squalenifaciens DSM 18772]|uniref:Uncharacterized protein n=1 Tax=Rubritalea squalenifaciens DSM 18772 TaxID=1123071 RepID=A0A1M6LNV7_9BACT|nr:hypothetical protein [Rubritalea squalenifaciens]SHJ72845.1 hypothetical protein SAMN02745181_2454 [Rubritalea squalenifaciens DSM 18772]